MNVGEILKNDQFYRTTGSKANGNISIELPSEIQNLITGSDYWQNAKRNRYKKLIREGHMNDLLQLAALAHERAKTAPPSHWFAKAASKVEWERTLDFLAKLRKVAQDAAEVAKRLAVPADNMKAVYKACWTLGGQVIRHSVTASEIGKDSYRYFNWLCAREKLTTQRSIKV